MSVLIWRCSGSANRRADIVRWSHHAGNHQPERRNLRQHHQSWINAHTDGHERRQN